MFSFINLSISPFALRASIRLVQELDERLVALLDGNGKRLWRKAVSNINDLVLRWARPHLP
jgi:hypothetical protein